MFMIVISDPILIHLHPLGVPLIQHPVGVPLRFREGFLQTKCSRQEGVFLDYKIGTLFLS
jgi:hypothetical protein